MNLKAGEHVVGMSILPPELEFTEDGSTDGKYPRVYPDGVARARAIVCQLPADSVRRCR